MSTKKRTTLASTTSATASKPLKRIPDLDHTETCAQRLSQKLLELKQQKVLFRSLQPNTNEFEILEFYGDALLYQRVSFFLMQTRRFMDPHLMTQVRKCCIKNDNLAQVYDKLQFHRVVNTRSTTLPLKKKADVVEAILGELGEQEPQDNSLTAPLNELFAFIAYLGEKTHFQSIALLEAQEKQPSQALKLDSCEVNNTKQLPANSTPTKNFPKKPTNVPHGVSQTLGEDLRQKWAQTEIATGATPKPNPTNSFYPSSSLTTSQTKPIPTPKQEQTLLARQALVSPCSSQTASQQAKSPQHLDSLIIMGPAISSWDAKAIFSPTFTPQSAHPTFHPPQNFALWQGMQIST